MSKFSDRQQQMFSIVEAFRESQLTRIEFCRQHNIPLSRFQYWQKKYRESQDPAPGGFVHLVSADQKAGVLFPGSIILQYPNGVSLQLPSGTPLGTIRSLLSLV